MQLADTTRAGDSGTLFDHIGIKATPNRTKMDPFEYTEVNAQTGKDGSLRASKRNHEASRGDGRIWRRSTAGIIMN